MVRALASSLAGRSLKIGTSFNLAKRSA